MIKSAELKGPSCLTQAADDEPLFVLRANDESAPRIVRIWALGYYEAKTAAGEITPLQRQKYQDALSLAHAMEDWKKAHP